MRPLGSILKVFVVFKASAVSELMCILRAVKYIKWILQITPPHLLIGKLSWIEKIMRYFLVILPIWEGESCWEKILWRRYLMASRFCWVWLQNITGEAFMQSESSHSPPTFPVLTQPTHPPSTHTDHPPSQYSHSPLTLPVLTQSIRFHPASHVDCVAKQAVSWHLVPNNSCHTRTYSHNSQKKVLSRMLIPHFGSPRAYWASEDNNT